VRQFSNIRRISYRWWPCLLPIALLGCYFTTSLQAQAPQQKAVTQIDRLLNVSVGSIQCRYINANEIVVDSKIILRGPNEEERVIVENVASGPRLTMQFNDSRAHRATLECRATSLLVRWMTANGRVIREFEVDGDGTITSPSGQQASPASAPADGQK